MQIPLVGGAYKDRSPIASAQETINLYPEKNKGNNNSFPVTHYLTPGSTIFATPPVAVTNRCTYRTTLGTAYTVVGTNVYFVAPNGALIFVGAIPDLISQVYMADNGLVVVLTDGVNGFAINMADNAFGQIIDAAFYGADFVVFLDTFFVFNRPDTNQFYISLSMVDYAQLTGGTAFDPLDIAAKSGSADPIVGIATVHKELWLIGALTTEVWIGTGAADFYFQLVQGAYIDHGCAAPYSIASQDVLVFWLMQDRQGHLQIMKGAGYEVQDIGTSYLVNEFQQYETTADAIGFVFQQEDHAFYGLVFPTANVTWLYDLTSNEWVRWSWLDENGNINRHRANCAMFFNGNNVVGDWENGQLYILNPNIYTDFDGPIMRRKTFAHMIQGDYQRVMYNSFDAYIQVGTQAEPDPDNIPTVDLSWSDNGGITYGNPVPQGFGEGGDYLTTVSWNRLGMARDRLFKLEWSAAIKTSLAGAFVTARVART